MLFFLRGNYCSYLLCLSCRYREGRELVIASKGHMGSHSVVSLSIGKGRNLTWLAGLVQANMDNPYRTLR